MSIKTIKQRVSILKQFNFQLKEAKQAKNFLLKALLMGII